MSGNPISYTEIEAFARSLRTQFTAWEIDVLVRIDDAFLNAEASVPSKPASDNEAAAIPVSDAKGVRNMFRGLKAFKRQQAEQRKESPNGRSR